MSSWSRTTNVFLSEKPTNTIVKSISDVPPKRDLVNMVYATPKCMDTVVIMVFFNPAGSFRILQNLLYVKQQLTYASIPFFIGELAYNDEPHVIPGAFQFRSSSYMFSKEKELNAVLAKDELKAFSKYIIMDCDIVFDTADWIDGISAALDKYEVIQPYQYANLLNLKFKSESMKQSIVFNPACGHPGYVWSFRRDWLERIGGLYEYALIGGGDMCLAHMCGFTTIYFSNIYKDDISVTASNSNENTSYLPYSIWHLPHGQPEKRRYMERMQVICRTMNALRIDRLRNAVDRVADGIFEWKPQYKAHLNSVLLNYFKSREDDG